MEGFEPPAYGDRIAALDWRTTKDLFRRAFRSSLHFAVATVAEDGAPHVAPIGSMILTEPGRGFFFDIFTTTLADNLDRSPRATILAVDSSRWFWLKSLARGRFTSPVAVRLQATIGPRRPATAEEQERFLRRVRPVRRLKGHQLLWGNLRYVRDITIDGSQHVDLGAMTQH